MSDTLLACRDCGQLHRAANALVPGHRLACIRCGRGLSRYPPTGLDAPLALATTALILLLLANIYPIFLVNREGRAGQDLLISGALRLSEYGAPLAGLRQLVTAAPEPGATAGRRLCPRCATALEPRQPGSLSATLALISAAAILYLPANLLAVMTVERFGRVNSYTILAGVEELANLGMWPLALLVFFASIVVPMLKLVSLGWFLYAIRRRSPRRLRERTRLYRLIDVVGRWSNIDVFMVSILAASLQFGFLTTVDPEAGIVSFAVVVVLTMLATTIFDPRLMWDAARGEVR